MCALRSTVYGPGLDSTSPQSKRDGGGTMNAGGTWHPDGVNIGNGAVRECGVKGDGSPPDGNGPFEGCDSGNNNDPSSGCSVVTCVTTTTPRVSMMK